MEVKSISIGPKVDQNDSNQTEKETHIDPRQRFEDEDEDYEEEDEDFDEYNCEEIGGLENMKIEEIKTKKHFIEVNVGDNVSVIASAFDDLKVIY